MFLEFFFSLLVTIFFIIINIKSAKKFKLIDIPNNRSSHSIPKPKGAGIGIFFSIILTFLTFNHQLFIQHYVFFISLSIIFIIGLIDDIKDISPNIKFFFITFATIVIYFSKDIRLKSLGEWFDYNIMLPSFLSFFLIIVIVNALTNAINLIDGLDGLASGVSIIIFSTFLYFGFIYKDHFMILLSTIFVSSLLGFLLFNWYPSKIFLGDTGSLVIGFSISILTLKLINYINITSLLFLLAIPIIDTLIVMIRRIQRKQSPFKADKSHIHHKILRWKTKVDYSVMLILLIQLTFSLFGILIANQKNEINLIIFMLMTYLFFLIFDDRKTPRNNQIFLFHTKISNFFLNQKKIYFLLIILIFFLLLIKTILNSHSIV